MSSQTSQTQPKSQSDHPTDREILTVFVALAFVFFAAPLVQKSYVVTVLDVIFIFISFVAVILIEGVGLVGVLRLERRWQWMPVTSFLLAAGLMAANVFHFFFVVSNAAATTFFIILMISSTLLLASFWSAKAGKFVRWFCVVMLLIMCTTEWIMQHSLSERGTQDYPIVNEGYGQAQKSVYVIAFDALASRQALKELYDLTDLPHVKYLEKIGFQLYDTVSPGYDTTDTFVSWYSLGAVHSARNSKHLFNGVTNNPLYSLLHEKKFKIQFIYHSNYFGVDAGRIDSFYPQHNTISICEFVDTRYGFGVCSKWATQVLWKPVLLLVNKKDLLVPNNESTGGYEFVANRLEFSQRPDPARWFSVSYVFFPGHAGIYPGDDLAAKEKYRNLMAEKLPQLNDQFGFIQQQILSHDPEAAIVFIGDHGGWLTGRWEIGGRDAPTNGTKALLDLDRSGILLAVYPNTFCQRPLSEMKDSTLVLKILVDCST